jgi:hypothetical protein
MQFIQKEIFKIFQILSMNTAAFSSLRNKQLNELHNEGPDDCLFRAEKMVVKEMYGTYNFNLDISV